MSEQAKDGGAAFPGEEICHYRDPRTLTPEGREGNDYTVVHPGMKLRDYLAAHAMQGIVAATYWKSLTMPHDKHKDYDATVAGAAYQIADAMLREREAKP